MYTHIISIYIYIIYICIWSCLCISCFTKFQACIPNRDIPSSPPPAVSRAVATPHAVSHRSSRRHFGTSNALPPSVRTGWEIYHFDGWRMDVMFIYVYIYIYVSLYVYVCMSMYVYVCRCMSMFTFSVQVLHLYNMFTYANWAGWRIGPGNLFCRLIWQVWYHPLQTSAKQGVFRGSCRKDPWVWGKLLMSKCLARPTTLSSQNTLLEKRWDIKETRIQKCVLTSSTTPSCAMMSPVSSPTSVDMVSEQSPWGRHLALRQMQMRQEWIAPEMPRLEGWTSHGPATLPTFWIWTWDVFWEILNCFRKCYPAWPNVTNNIWFV